MWNYLLAGAAAGSIAGLFGAGGGLVLVPLLRRCQLTGAQGRARIALFQRLYGFVEEDGRLGPGGAVRCVCGLVAGRAHRVAGAAGSTGVFGIAQQVQRMGGVLFGVQQHPHTQGGVQLAPARPARKVGHPLVILRVLLLALGDVFQQGVQAVGTGLSLPVPAQQPAADLVAGRFDLKCHLQCFVWHSILP